ncbi:MAG: hypothetical protein E2O52_00505 [Gammaproteobacteria bacterium]|nr:MAG: hypothetical protein E2O52_00505 [Gammaproteobacteria bacterium]
MWPLLPVIEEKKMRRLILITFLVSLPFSTGVAQGSAKTLASTLEVFVFPTEGQASDQQSKDEAACYNWATDNTGNDPFELQKQTEQQAQQTDQQVQQAKSATQGAGVRGAARGAAAGALIGEIANDDAGKGAAYGAAAGAVMSRRRSRAASQQAQQQAQQQGAAQQQATAEQIDNFKKAFSVCLEAKDYMVKF